MNQPCAATLWQALSTNNIDMSSTESSGAPAEASATTTAPVAAASFGSTRGSGLARGKAKRPSAPASSTAASADYTPTAIAVVTAPREYQNPFAPVETPASVTATPAALSAEASAPVESIAAAPVAPVKEYSPPSALAPTTPESNAVETPAPVHSEAAAAPAVAEQTELNILPPAEQKTAPAQTWESEGFRPARETRTDRPRREDARREEPRREEPRREERTERAPREERAAFDPSTIPEKFLYVRPGYNYVPTPSNYGGAPREPRGERAPVSGGYVAPAAPTAKAAPEKSGGFFGWLKSLFGAAPEAPAPVEARPSEAFNGDRSRGDRGRSGPGGGGDGQRRRSRGGRGRNPQRGEYRNGGDQGGSSAA